MTDDVCTCPEVYAGMHATGSKNWNPDCPEHGLDTEWLANKQAESMMWQKWTDREKGVPEL